MKIIEELYFQKLRICIYVYALRRIDKFLFNVETIPWKPHETS